MINDPNTVEWFMFIHNIDQDFGQFILFRKKLVIDDDTTTYIIIFM